ncbi:hypothetical protein Ciccas_007402 [Cichlidogyrus casuarinus]|uniref:Uncharacterized protein n=1 Tax=Cichlidogyrus casuarinus TaxID=1844966 RepID=A0ABD2Q359_9PLAT
MVFFTVASIAKPLLGVAFNIGINESCVFIGSKLYGLIKSISWRQTTIDQKWKEYETKLHECINISLNAQLEYEQMADKFPHDAQMKEHYVLCAQWCHAMAKYLLNLNEKTTSLYSMEDKEIEQGFTVIKANSVFVPGEKNKYSKKEQMDVELNKLEWFKMLVNFQEKLEKILSSMRLDGEDNSKSIIGQQLHLFELGNRLLESSDNMDLADVSSDLNEVIVRLNQM